jgi:hypothetical protein
MPTAPILGSFSRSLPAPPHHQRRPTPMRSVRPRVASSCHCRPAASSDPARDGTAGPRPGRPVRTGPPNIGSAGTRRRQHPGTAGVTARRAPRGSGAGGQHGQRRHHRRSRRGRRTAAAPRVGRHRWRGQHRPWRQHPHAAARRGSRGTGGSGRCGCRGRGRNGRSRRHRWQRRRRQRRAGAAPGGTGGSGAPAGPASGRAWKPTPLPR